VTVRLGTRGSALALAQARATAAALERLGERVELVTIGTAGDEGQPGHGDDDKARFVKELERALLDGEIDLAVHSAKDVPAELPEGLEIAGVPAREDARDALCVAASVRSVVPAATGVGAPAGRHAGQGVDSAAPGDDPPAQAGDLALLAQGARVGTASLRRRSQLLALRPDLDVRELRGNVDTRLRKLAGGEIDALVLAVAGLRRLGRAEAGAPIGADVLVPAAGQGCLALEARADDGRARDLAARLTDADAQLALTVERALVAALDATCQTPVGAHATRHGETIRLSAYVGAADGSTWIRDALGGPRAAPAELGERAAARLLDAGAGALLAQT
jgi:hydroxymethylbilane synthase